MNVTAIQNVLHAWLAAATGLPCLWEKQNGLAQRPASYCTLDLGGLLLVGGHVAAQDFSAERPAGEEVEVSTGSNGEWTLRAQTFVDLSEGQTGDAAVSLLGGALARLRLPSVRVALEGAGIGVISVGAVQNLTGLAGVRWQGRATAEVRLSVVESVSERTGYIETAEVTTVLRR